MRETFGGRRISRCGSGALSLAITVGTIVGLANPAAGAVQASTPVLRAVVTLSRGTSSVGQRVTASVSHSTLPTGDTVKSVTLDWGDRTKRVALANLRATATHTYSTPGRYTVVLSITDRTNKIARGVATEVVRALLGSYSGTNPQSGYRSISFYVSQNQTALQDISISDIYMTCSPGGALARVPFGIAAAALAVNGSFNTTTTRSGVYSGYPATFTDTFQGNFHGGTVSGTYRESLAYSDSAARTCTSNAQSWTATRDTQPAQTAAAPPVGSYAGFNPQSGYKSIAFYVSSNRTALQDISISDINMTCSPGGAVAREPFGIASVPVASNGSFNTTTTRSGVYKGYPATFTDTFQGNFHSVGPTGAARAAGSFRETVAYTDSAARSCTSNDQSWTTTRDTQPAQTAAAPPAGSYAGINPQSGYKSLAFQVSADQTTLQTISISDLYMTCSPGGAIARQPFGIASAAVAANGSFTITTTESGLYQGNPATFTYTFLGNFHSVGASGAERAAGLFTETLSYTDSAAHSCTTNDQSWTATRTG